MTAALTLEAAKAMSKVIDQIHVEDGHPELAIPFEDLPADEKVRRLRMVTAVGDAYGIEYLTEAIAHAAVPLEALLICRRAGLVDLSEHSWGEIENAVAHILPAMRAAQGQAK